MTVQELIDHLMAVRDKTLVVYYRRPENEIADMAIPTMSGGGSCVLLLHPED